MIKVQLEEVRKQIATAAYEAKRDVNDITLIAVSKTYPASAID